MTHVEDLARFKDNRIESMEIEIKKLTKKIEFLEAVLEVGQEVTFNKQ